MTRSCVQASTYRMDTASLKIFALKIFENIYEIFISMHIAKCGKEIQFSAPLAKKITDNSHKYSEATDPYGAYRLAYRKNLSFGKSLCPYSLIMPRRIAKSP